MSALYFWLIFFGFAYRFSSLSPRVEYKGFVEGTVSLLVTIVLKLSPCFFDVTYSLICFFKFLGTLDACVSLWYRGFLFFLL